MSHTTTLKGIKITDITALEDAVIYLRDSEKVKGIQFKKNAKPRMYYPEQEVMCDYVVKLPGRFDVGFQKQEDGSYAPIFDEWSNGYEKFVRDAIGVPGPDAIHHISRLVDLYGVHLAANQLAVDGYGYNPEIYYNEEEGSYVLEVGSAY